MRIIGPEQLKAAKQKRDKKPRLSNRILLVIVLMASFVGGFTYFQNSNLFQPSQQIDDVSNNTADQSQEEPEPRQLREFTADEFKSLYSAYAYPNTQPLQEPPKITDDPVADERIRNIARERGYKLSSVPVANIADSGELGLDESLDLMQPNALIAWREMKQAALEEGIKLQLTSAYRSIEDQRALFLRRMKADGVYVDSVANGYVDHLVEKLLARAAPPGYSRHHNGYTIDLACEGIGLDAFTATPCFTWLSKNNYENTKKHGWVPSYPAGASMQGPEPEPWEYIWVSTYSLYE